MMQDFNTGYSSPWPEELRSGSKAGDKVSGEISRNRLYPVRIRHNNSSLKTVFYAGFDSQKKQYIASCSDLEGRTRAGVCEEVCREEGFKKILSQTDSVTGLTASRYEQGNWFWKLWSELILARFSSYPVNVDQILDCCRSLPDAANPGVTGDLSSSDEAPARKKVQLDESLDQKQTLTEKAGLSERSESRGQGLAASEKAIFRPGKRHLAMAGAGVLGVFALFSTRNFIITSRADDPDSEVDGEEVRDYIPASDIFQDEKNLVIADQARAELRQNNENFLSRTKLLQIQMERIVHRKYKKSSPLMPLQQLFTRWIQVNQEIISEGSAWVALIPEAGYISETKARQLSGASKKYCDALGVSAILYKKYVMEVEKLQKSSPSSWHQFEEQLSIPREGELKGAFPDFRGMLIEGPQYITRNHMTCIEVQKRLNKLQGGESRDLFRELAEFTTLNNLKAGLWEDMGESLQIIGKYALEWALPVPAGWLTKMQTRWAGLESNAGPGSETDQQEALAFKKFRLNLGLLLHAKKHKGGSNREVVMEYLARDVHLFLTNSQSDQVWADFGEVIVSYLKNEIARYQEKSPWIGAKIKKRTEVLKYLTDFSMTSKKLYPDLFIEIVSQNDPLES